MKDEEVTELLTRVLDGYASEEDRARALAILRQRSEIRGEAADQLLLDGLLGIALQSDEKKSQFRDELMHRLARSDKHQPLRRLESLFLRNTRWLALALGPVLAALTWVALSFMLEGSPIDNPNAACWTGAILALCATWWIFEPIPIPATSLIPLAVFPLVGVLDEREIAASYGHHLVILFLTGFMLFKAMERSGAHRRLALGMVRIIGGSSGRRLVLGFMVASAVLSMWISNTATALMLLPVAVAVIDQCHHPRLATPLLLGIAYAASIGGIATPIGTPPNTVFLAQADLLVAEGTLAAAPSFLGWMKLGMPVVLVMIPAAWLWLTRGHWSPSKLDLGTTGPWTKPEIRVVAIFALAALLWITRVDPYGGWTALLGLPAAKDSTVGLLAVVLLFIIPRGDSSGQKLLDWEHAAAIPWGTLILFGGGIAIGNAFASSGLSQVLAGNMHNISDLPTVLMIAIVVVSVTLLTEVTSNTATATLLMPLLAATAIAADIRPELLMVPAAMSASCAFMLPVASPPNAVAYAVGGFSIRRMVFEGMALNVMSSIVITTACYFLLG